jgi:hypothetical protein
MRSAEQSATHAILHAVSAAYPVETESLRASSVGVLGIPATLQQVVDLNSAFLAQLRTDGLQLAEIATLLGALGVCSAGSSISVKSLQSAMSRAHMRSNQSASLQATSDRNHRGDGTSARRLIAIAADCGTLQPTAASSTTLQGTASNCSSLRPAAANRSALRPTAAVCTGPQPIAGLGQQEPQAVTRSENASPISALIDLDPRIQKAAELLSRNGESNE